MTVIVLLVPIGVVVAGTIVASFVYGAEYVTRVLVMRESSQADYLENFPLASLSAAQQPRPFGSALDEERVGAVIASVLDVDDLDEFMTVTGTQAMIVIQHGELLFERYFNGADRNTMLTSFSVAKSFDSALVGIAIDEGFIDGVDDPITEYLPELAERDPGFERITVRHLLRMASGLDYDEMRWGLFNGDDPLTTYHPDQREITLQNTAIVDEPGGSFRYNKYHPQLLGMILERATGMSVTEFTQTRLWDPMGMEYDGAWALDSRESGFEKMEAGLNARAIDYAKLGQLYLEGGSLDGTPIVPESWVVESTVLDPAIGDVDYYPDEFGRLIYDDGDGWYGYMWYGKRRVGGPDDFYAEGDHGQFVYVVPARGLVIVRNGTEFGIAGSAWVDTFSAIAGDL
jgi:CubicO group peptidase (beta-lactamase class C family)